jgi:hypothetical protein
MSIDRAARIAVAAVCGYEVAAIAGAPVPTLTAICSHCRWLIPAVVVAVAIHLWFTPPADLPTGRKVLPGG